MIKPSQFEADMAHRFAQSPAGRLLAGVADSPAARQAGDQAARLKDLSNSPQMISTAEMARRVHAEHATPVEIPERPPHPLSRIVL